MAFRSLLRALAQRTIQPPPPAAGPGRDLAEIGIRLVDDAYMTWFAAARECERALRAWQRAEPRAYWAYRAALDREEAAARDLERLSELARPCERALARPTLSPR
jgi:hypothetical protein